jgi:hypothetical protein
MVLDQSKRVSEVVESLALGGHYVSINHPTTRNCKTTQPARNTELHEQHKKNMNSEETC